VHIAVPLLVRDWNRRANGNDPRTIDAGASSQRSIYFAEKLARFIGPDGNLINDSVILTNDAFLDARTARKREMDKGRR
jgi:hypothetical protein